MKKASQVILSLSLLINVSSVVFAQSFWVKKGYTEWTKSDVEKLASDSPWSKLVSDESNNSIFASYFIVRLRSALPVRQAIVRWRQIEAKYDKMNEQQRTAFDLKTKYLLECSDCRDNYVINISPPMSDRVTNGMQSLMNIQFELLKGNIYLINDRGEKRELVRYVAPLTSNDEATLFFSRLDERGKSLLTKENKSVTLVVDKRGHSHWKKVSFPLSTKFDVQKLLIKDEVQF